MKPWKKLTLLCALLLCLALCACTKEEPTIDPSAPSETAAPTEQEVKVDERLEKIGRQPDYRTETFGKNVLVFSPADDPAQVLNTMNLLFNKQQKNQFGDNRTAVYFLPGEYDPMITMRVGFYTQIAGLGYSPDDTVLRAVNAEARWLGDNGNHNATCNFWRGIENFSTTSDMMWAVSQATFMRRVHVGGNLAFHDNWGWASGGFMADCVVDGTADSGSQQQWLSRNSDWKNWTGDNWNIVFAGIEPGKLPAGDWPQKAYTSVEKTDYMQEKPYLVYDEEQGFGVFVPEAATDCVGITWKEATPGTFLPLGDFYVAKADTDDAASLNAALASGKHLFLTPGIYDLTEEIVVSNPNTIILGTGLATLRAVNGSLCMRVEAPDGMILAGLLFDAGEECSPLLLRVGEKGQVNEKPSLLADLFFRVGGAAKTGTAVDTCAEINCSNVLGDNFWVWRADHGEQVGWDVNPAETGLVVNGDDVTIYALMVEHFRQYQTVWNGNGGKVVMYQSETPYDVPSQDVYVSHDGTVNGFASYKVSDEVESHEAIGIGIYSYNRDAVIEIHSAMEMPEKENVTAYHVIAVMITGNPGITHPLNEYGESCLTGVSTSKIIHSEWNQ